jgi:glucan 1,3-beta-glucosidase
MTDSLILDCDNSIQNGGALAPDGDFLCNMPCTGNNAEMCGGPNRVGVYSYGFGNGTA